MKRQTTPRGMLSRNLSMKEEQMANPIFSQVQMEQRNTRIIYIHKMYSVHALVFRLYSIAHTVKLQFTGWQHIQ